MSDFSSDKFNEDVEDALAKCTLHANRGPDLIGHSGEFREFISEYLHPLSDQYPIADQVELATAAVLAIIAEKAEWPDACEVVGPVLTYLRAHQKPALALIRSKKPTVKTDEFWNSELQDWNDLWPKAPQIALAYLLGWNAEQDGWTKINPLFGRASALIRPYIRNSVEACLRPLMGSVRYFSCELPSDADLYSEMLLNGFLAEKKRALPDFPPLVVLPLDSSEVLPEFDTRDLSKATIKLDMLDAGGFWSSGTQVEVKRRVRNGWQPFSPRLVAQGPTTLIAETENTDRIRIEVQNPNSHADSVRVRIVELHFSGLDEDATGNPLIPLKHSIRTWNPNVAPLGGHLQNFVKGFIGKWKPGGFASGALIHVLHRDGRPIVWAKAAMRQCSNQRCGRWTTYKCHCPYCGTRCLKSTVKAKRILLSLYIGQGGGFERRRAFSCKICDCVYATDSCSLPVQIDLRFDGRGIEHFRVDTVDDRTLYSGVGQVFSIGTSADEYGTQQEIEKLYFFANGKQQAEIATDCKLTTGQVGNTDFVIRDGKRRHDQPLNVEEHEHDCCPSCGLAHRVRAWICDGNGCNTKYPLDRGCCPVCGKDSARATKTTPATTRTSAVFFYSHGAPPDALGDEEQDFERAIVDYFAAIESRLPDVRPSWYPRFLDVLCRQVIEEYGGEKVHGALALLEGMRPNEGVWNRWLKALPENDRPDTVDQLKETYEDEFRAIIEHVGQTFGKGKS